jgi:hypothetical protein
MTGYKTIIGLAIATVPTVAHLFGFTVAPGFEAQVGEILDSIVQLGGLAFALYGRIKAQGPLWFAK